MTGNLNALFSLVGRRALVTGGSVSIGRAISIALARSGADVAIQYSPSADLAFSMPDASEVTRSEIESLGRNAYRIPADFSEPGEAARCVSEARNSLGGIDILVIAASVQVREVLEEISNVELARQTTINFTATVELLRAAVPDMAQRGWGRVLSIGSVNQFRPEPQLAVYAALKAAQANLIGNLAKQYARSGVTFNTLSPGLVATERNRWRRQDPDSWAEVQRTANPMGRAGTPDEMVGPALLLCSEGSAFITGVDLLATGGAHL